MSKSSTKFTTLVFFVNGKKVVETEPDPECTLLTYLREKLRLCGTKLGCAEGGCGACTVMISKYNRSTKEVKHLAVNACLTPVCSLHGLSVTTVEGIGSTRTRLHPVQERIAKAHGSQCGFCTPGIVMSMYALLRSSPTPTMKDLEVAFQGNLCRCTGYRPIIEGYKTFTAEYKTAACPMGEKCCKVNKGGCGPDLGDKLFEPSKFAPFDPTQEPIFPPELKVNAEYDDQVLSFANKDGISWERPTTLEDLLKIKKNHPAAKIIVGNTEVGVEQKFKRCVYPVLVNPSQVNELNKIEVLKNCLKFGASVTLMEMEEALQKQINTLPEYETRLFVSVVKMLHYFAGKQIRNVASVGGNIMTGSPISDLNPIFTAAGIELEVESLDRGKRTLRKGKGFYTGYRKNIVEPDEVLISICIQKTGKDQYFEALKQAKRRDDDIAIVNGAFNVIFKDGTDIIEDIHLAFGGMAPTTVLAPKTSAAVIGKKWNSEIVEIVNKSLLEELPLSGGAPGGMILYRRSLTLSLFFKAYLAISQSLEKTISGRVPISEREKSGANVFHTLTPKSVQFFERPPKGQATSNPMRKPLVHSSAFKQATGEAVYCDDIPRFENELYLGMVLSTKAHAKIISVDATEALNQPGVHAFFSGKDIPDEANKIGVVFHDEELFVKDTVTSQGQLIGAIIADDQKTAQRAARLVNVVYEDLFPIIVTLEDAIAQKSFFPNYPLIIKYGDVESAFKTSDHVIEGEFRIGGQEHFYLETNVSVAIPNDTDELEIFCSSQNPSEIQKLAAKILEIPANRVVARTKRLGGGFGGKESKATLVALPVAFAAYKLGRPVRLALDRDEDMMITGTRHPFYFKWKVSFTKTGELTGCDINIYNNAGCTMDLSFSVLERSMLHFQCCYRMPNVRVTGWVCRTNLPSNTAFRGFGGPQGMMAGEHIIRAVARTVGKDYKEIQRLNMFVQGDQTHYNQELPDFNITKCFDGVLESSNYEIRQLKIEQFNRENRWRKRGISLTNTMFGIAFTAQFLNQSGALVHVYLDGSVLVSHGGVEMGQGLHIKMIQVAAATLQIPAERIHISETATNKVPNTSPTAASASSDLNGMAVLNACQVIFDRLAVYRVHAPSDGWDKWVNQAYLDRVSLSATGFHATPELGYSFATNLGRAFNYFTYGSAISEVEIDCLSGDHQVIRTDIVMDLGSSINPAIDIGQIEGAFMQGYGLFTLEELIYSPTGTLYSRGPGMYKLPGFSDIPGEFNVSLLTGSPNPRAVFSSKAVGEPPLFLASSIFFAIKEAIAAARKEENLEEYFMLESPATSSRIRMGCSDKFTKMIKEDTTNFVPWSVVP